MGIAALHPSYETTMPAFVVSASKRAPRVIVSPNKMNEHLCDAGPPFVQQCLTSLQRMPKVAASFNTVKQGLLMEIVLRKYGNSTVAVLPPAVLKDLGLSAGQRMSLATTDQGQIVLARKRVYVLSDLIAQCDPNAPPPLKHSARSRCGRCIWVMHPRPASSCTICNQRSRDGDNCSRVRPRWRSPAGNSPVSINAETALAAPGAV